MFANIPAYGYHLPYFEKEKQVFIGKLNGMNQHCA
jgi:hypothetical protein